MKDKQFLSIIKIIVPISIIVIILILFFIYPGFLRDSYNAEPLPNKQFSIWDDQNIVEQLKPADRVLEQAFRDNFLIDFEEEYQVVVSNIVVDRNKEPKADTLLVLDDQLLWGKYLALAGEEKEFNNWLQMLENFYFFEDSWATELNVNAEIIEKTETTWPYDLKYADVLLSFYNRNPSQNIMQKIEMIMDRALVFFSQDKLPSNYTSRVERIFYPETSSDSEPTQNPELIDPYSEVEFIRLSDIDLFVLESFSIIDSKWMQIYEHWSQIITDSIEPEAIFYPFGVWPDEDDYVATVDVAFAASTYDTVRVVKHLDSDQQNLNTEGFLTRQIMQGNKLFRSYNMASLQIVNEQTDISAMALYSEHIVNKLAEPTEYKDSEIINAIYDGLIINQLKDEFSLLQHLFYHATEDGSLIFSASDQLNVLNSGLIK